MYFYKMKNYKQINRLKSVKLKIIIFSLNMKENWHNRIEKCINKKYNIIVNFNNKAFFKVLTYKMKIW